MKPDAIILGIIPARKGSKRLARKNVRELGGKPLIVWTIEAAKQSKRLTKIVCSTDDEEVMSICAKHEVPVIFRPAELATDEARSEDVVLHVLSLIPCDYVCLLQPTSPFRSADDIDGCLAVLDAGPCLTETEGRPGVPNGAAYAAPADRFRAFGFLPAMTYPMPAERSIDIDTEEDLRRAETMLREQAINAENCAHGS